VKTASEMTYTVLGGVLNSTQSNPSVCLSVTLKLSYHICWNTSKIFLQLISLGSSPSLGTNVMSLLQSEYHEILYGIGVWYSKGCFWHAVPMYLWNGAKYSESY